MDLLEAKQYLNSKGFILEDTSTNTKSLVAKFWALRKKGETLSKEDAEQLLNAVDFKEVVNPKYQNFIKSSLNKILGNAPAKKPGTELFGTVPLYGEDHFAVLGVPVNLETNKKKEKQEELKKEINKIVDSYNEIKEEYKKLKSEGISDSNLKDFVKLLVKIDESSKTDTKVIRDYFISTMPIYRATDRKILFYHTEEGAYKKILDKLDKYICDYKIIEATYDLLVEALKNLNYEVKWSFSKTIIKGKNSYVEVPSVHSNNPNLIMQLNLNYIKHDFTDYYKDNFNKLVKYYDTKEFPEFTFKNLEKAFAYMEEIYPELKRVKDEEDKKKAEEFKKWYDSLSDIARDQYNYYREHPNGNWSGD